MFDKYKREKICLTITTVDLHNGDGYPFNHNAFLTVILFGGIIMRPVQMAVLLSSVLVSASAFAAAPKADVTVATQYRPVSTGVVAPVLEGNQLHINPIAAAASSGEVVLSLQVDEKGDARNVHVVKSASPLLDSKVVAAVLQSRFKPATLNNQAIPVDLALTVKVQ